VVDKSIKFKYNKRVWGDKMKHIFIVNPAAGSHDVTDEVRIKLEQLNLDINYEIYRTASAGDATRYVKSVLENTSEKVRFYACGGDGTLNEVVNGAVNYDNASVTVFPCGSGNDFIKCFGGTDKFSDLTSLIYGTEQKTDVIKACDKYAINAVHFGLDTHVLRTMLKVKRKKIIGGKRAYITGVLTALVNGMKTDCKMTVDGESFGKDTMLLCTVANGQYVGGMFKCAPKADTNDGLLEVCFVNKISRFTFVRLVSCYVKGTHLDDPRFDKYISYKRAKKVNVTIPYGYISIDGELTETTEFTAEVVENALNFVIPDVKPKIETVKEDEQVVS
jgi:diacylglycerol kinase (ATP)